MSFSWRKVFAISLKNLQILMRDKRTVGLLIGMPIIIMILFGYGFGQPIKDVPIKLVNLDQGGTGIPMMGISDTKFSDIAIETIQNDDRVAVTVLDPATFNIDDEKTQIYGGNNYYALIVFPIDFSEHMPNQSISIQLVIYVDGSEVQTVGSVKAAIADMVTAVMNAISGVAPHVQISFDYVYGNPDLRPVDTMAPGILGFAILLFMILTVTGGFTKERLSGTLSRVQICQTSKMEIVFGYMIGNSLIAMIQSALLLVIGVLVFNIVVNGNLFLLFLMLFVYAICCVGIGMFLSTFAQNELQAFQFIPVTIIPFMFFSGFILPMNAFPQFFRYLSYVIPLTYSIRINRAIMLNGFGFEWFVNDFLALLGLTALFITLAIVGFKVKK